MPFAWILRANCGTSRFKRLLHWPSTPNPTPYQIFGLSPDAQPDQRKVRQIYFELVKTYHPDRGGSGDAEKFKQIVHAHSILKDENLRRSYDLERAMARRYQPSPRHAQQPFDAYSNMNYWSSENQQKFDKALYENRIWVLKLVVTVTVVVAVLNMVFLKQAASARNEMLNRETEKVSSMLAQSLSGHSHDDQPQGRIERFLAHRQRTLDRYNSEFSWDNLCRGVKRDGTRLADVMPHPAQPDRPRLPGSTGEYAAEPPASPPRDPGSGKSYMKQHSGPVAEYFGRN